MQTKQNDFTQEGREELSILFPAEVDFTLIKLASDQFHQSKPVLI